MARRLSLAVLSKMQQGPGTSVLSPGNSLLSSPNQVTKVAQSPLEILGRLAYTLVPQVARTQFFRDPVPTAKLFPTSSLDGLRGFACIIIFHFHLLFTYTDMTGTAYGFDAKHMWLIELPIIRLLYSGRTMVNIFFIASGFAISYKPLQLMGRRDSAGKLLQTLSSSVFRRGIRLYFPVIFSTFVLMLLIRAGFFEPARPYSTNQKYLKGIAEMHQLRFGTFKAQWDHWVKMIVKLTNIFDFKSFLPDYDNHLWTIPMEFRSSIVLYVVLLCVARTRVVVRRGIIALFIFFCIRCGRSELVLFFSGTLIADFSLGQNKALSEKSELLPTIIEPHSELASSTEPLLGVPHDPPPPYTWTLLFSPKSKSNLFRFITFYLTLGFSLWLMSSPTLDYDKTWGYMTLARTTPSSYRPGYRWLQSIGSIGLIYCISISEPTHWLQRMFTTPLAQYLGKISFAFYIVHGPILHAVGYLVVCKTWDLLPGGRETLCGYLIGLGVGWTVCGGISLWLADVFQREVDKRCVLFAKWVEERCMETEDN